ncbi:MAG: transposase [Nitrosomonas sp.]|nr:transposase [Nitrosomonas sp.]MDO8895947.1 transposase [Nitrosomonas sp.]MDO9470776.1 transposase [Nitrosomonas sp.]MDP1549874.1 transposase [Nitrosomonas sp.]MDP1786214.1 transposase [Nitrosomonas sp.]MDP1933470.1 transposase [Nitrosomonas sp.]
MERYLQESLVCKWFCDKEAPDHSYFSAFRKRLGTGKLMDYF